MAEIKSPISGGLRLARRTVSADTFVSAVPTQPAPAQPDPVTTSLIERNSLSLNSVAAQLSSVQQQVAALNASMQNVYGSIRQGADLERSKDIQEQTQQRQLAEQQLREGKENIIERRIQNAVIAPVQKISGKVQFTLSRLMGFFTTLLGGWLLNQGVQTIKAFSEGNKKRLEEIRDNVLKTLGVVGAIFLTIKVGLGTVLKTLVGLGVKIANAVAINLFVRPVQLLIDAVKKAGSKLLNLGRPSPPPAPKPTANAPSKPGGAGLNVKSNVAVGALMTGLDIAGGEDPIRAVAGATSGMIGSATAFGLGSLIPLPGTGVVAGALAYGPSAEFGKSLSDKFLGTKPKENKPTAKTQPTTAMKPAAADLQMSMDKSKSSEKSVEPDFSQPAEYGFMNLDVQVATGVEAEKMGSVAEGLSVTSLQPAQITPIKSETAVAAESVGPLPEPTPTILPMPILSKQAQQQTNKPSGTTGPSQIVPSFNPENPNNFYVMYSHSVYNVPMMM